MLASKKILCNIFNAFRIDMILRNINKNKLLVVMYHGVTKNEYDPPVWTQLPENIFIEQIKFIKSMYNVMSLSEVILCIRTGKSLPQRAALITFDDGFKNNYTVAFPILKQHSIPATIFLTMDFIDTDRIFWFDELLFLIKEVVKQRVKPEGIDVFDMSILENSKVWESYLCAVNKMKRRSEEDRELIMHKLRRLARIDKTSLIDDFGLLTQEQILEMAQSGLIDFGTHTANHRILTNIHDSEWEKEIKEPRERLSKILGKEAWSFCYPNGKPKTDFSELHIGYLKECGYVCAFTTEASLYDFAKGSPFKIGRIPAGNDLTSYLPYFRLATSGLF